MNYKTIDFMLNIKDVYTLLFLFLTQLGCSSSGTYKMDKQSTSSGQSSYRSEEKDDASGSVDRSNLNLIRNKVNKFLEKEEEDEDEKISVKIFEKGLSVDDKDIQSVVDKLGRTVDMFKIDSMDENYKTFLNEYGSIDGGGFDIYGPSQYVNSEDKIKEIVSIQKGFENRCKRNGMKKQKIKSCWLVAGVDGGDEYYIDLSGKNKNNIYSMSPDGEIKIFSRDFLEFLDKFLEAYERKHEEHSYKEVAYEETSEEEDYE